MLGAIYLMCEAVPQPAEREKVRVHLPPKAHFVGAHFFPFQSALCSFVLITFYRRTCKIPIGQRKTQVCTMFGADSSNNELGEAEPLSLFLVGICVVTM